jgi:CRP-like cAMP-binding protein
VLLGGAVKVHTSLPDGTEVILAVLGPGEVVGEMSVADSLGRSTSVLALEDSTLLWMDRRTFLSNMEEMPTIARNLVGILSRLMVDHLFDHLSVRVHEVPCGFTELLKSRNRLSKGLYGWRRGARGTYVT